MTLKDISTGPDWMLWAAFVVLIALSMLFLSGNGASLIAGYNTASKAEKSKYDEKKLCRVMGIGMTIISVLLFIMLAGQSVLPADFAIVFAVLVTVICIVMIILMNTICKK